MIHAASAVANLQFESTGAVGLWLKTDTPGLSVSIALDDPTTADRGVLRSVVADGQWHEYRWFLDRNADWDARPPPHLAAGSAGSPSHYAIGDANDPADNDAYQGH